MTGAFDQPSFWRWMWKGSENDWTGWQLAFAILVGLAAGAVTIPLWIWLAEELGGNWGFRIPSILSAILIAIPGVTAAKVTANKPA